MQWNKTFSNNSFDHLSANDSELSLSSFLKTNNMRHLSSILFGTCIEIIFRGYRFDELVDKFYDGPCRVNLSTHSGYGCGSQDMKVRVD